MAAEPGIAALTDTVGRPDALRASSRLPRDIAIAADDYRSRTGKWFDGDGFNLISSLPSGDIQAGSEATVSFKPLPDKDEADTNPMAVSFRMPERPDANYLLSIEMVSPEGEVSSAYPVLLAHSQLGLPQKACKTAVLI
ncbi:hypothetical protein ABU162_27715 [Paenibacillus thiaminolyticus]|uniref:hypothetical protein n=1 Tax=Paenibacillus thiaminolyticus TaxID=49283 RepID=UPI0035A661E8